MTQTMTTQSMDLGGELAVPAIEIVYREIRPDGTRDDKVLRSPVGPADLERLDEARGSEIDTTDALVNIAQATLERLDRERGDGTRSALLRLSYSAPRRPPARVFYAFQSPNGFGNEFCVHVFPSRAARDEWVAEHADDGDCQSAILGARAISAQDAMHLLRRPDSDKYLIRHGVTRLPLSIPRRFRRQGGSCYAND